MIVKNIFRILSSTLVLSTALNSLITVDGNLISKLTNSQRSDQNDHQQHDHLNDTLRMVFIIHRHGDRTPIQLYPKDPYQDQIKFWPDGWAQLTLVCFE